MIDVSLLVRPALMEDQQKIANLLFFESHVHRHLDWHAPLDWLGYSSFWVIEEHEQIIATLACPQDPPGVAWVRLFAHNNRYQLHDAWNALWKKAKNEIARNGGALVAVIATQTWLDNLLSENNFSQVQAIVMLEWEQKGYTAGILPVCADIRAMTLEDLPAVAALDAAAFSPLWQNPIDALAKAFGQAQVATVAEDEHGLAGYQISTANPFGAHLARLAVRPDAQGKGFGSAIIQELIWRLNAQNITRLTVNTQSNNAASLALYRKLGFKQTGEKFPVYCYDISPDQHSGR